MKKSNKIYVTKPLLPSKELLQEYITQIWESEYVTNMGGLHNELEIKLKSKLNVNELLLFNNGTIALLAALKAFGLPSGSEVITTPFTFAATPHCISWNNLKPIFCDIDAKTLTIDSKKIEPLITPKTSAILGVHVYGCPCDVYKIKHIADKYNLKIIYDAAHAFSTKVDNIDIGNFGDMTMFSFHATKLFNTIEGGCLAFNDSSISRKIYNLRNFGIQSEEIVEDVGINGKLNEIQAAVGLLNLDIVESEMVKREKIKAKYDDALSGIKGLRKIEVPHNATNSLQYYPIEILPDYSISRDQLYNIFIENNIFVRKYFYPLCSDYECYKELPTSHPDNLPIANKMKSRVLCLPFYGSLQSIDIWRIINIIIDNA